MRYSMQPRGKRRFCVYILECVFGAYGAGGGVTRGQEKSGYDRAYVGGVFLGNRLFYFSFCIRVWFILVS